MKTRERRTKPGGAQPFLEQARHSLRRQHLPRILGCLETLTQAQIWWRPHRTSNSIGNLVLHLAGNVRQWIISGLGNRPDQRDRDREFEEPGPVPRHALIQHLETTVEEACRVLTGISSRDFEREFHLQGFRVTGLNAITHVTEHFAYHTGQIIYATKLLIGADLGFTRLPGEKRKFPTTRKLSQF
ncbi:MAG TPA: DUF1572 family protein [Terriglobia bacterium]|nr:DUF1572 family protein [Terriglobia bacterium]